MTVFWFFVIFAVSARFAGFVQSTGANLWWQLAAGLGPPILFLAATLCRWVFVRDSYDR